MKYGREQSDAPNLEWFEQNPDSWKQWKNSFIVEFGKEIYKKCKESVKENYKELKRELKKQKNPKSRQKKLNL